MQHQTITTDEQLEQYCRRLAESPSAAFDTEFVSEHTYRPVLCLVQVATEDTLAVIDAVAVKDLQPFWETIAAEGRETIVHAARSEMEFCHRAIGRFPAGLFDVQLAAALIGAEYPAAYDTLIAKLLGEKPQKHERRTDWRRRPLSERQINYALDDVRYLHRMRDTIYAKLDELGRRSWIEDEMTALKEAVEHTQSRQRWRRLSGVARLRGRELAVARELYHWRDGEAERRDCPVRRVLRDDLIVELARRGTADVKRIEAVRGLERGDLRRRINEIAACIQKALELPEEEIPRRPPRGRPEKHSVLGQFLFAALGSVCRDAGLAPNLVGTPNDIRDLIHYRTEAAGEGGRVPKLARGWRAEFVGRLFDDLLAGKTTIRIADATSESPLAFEKQVEDEE